MTALLAIAILIVGLAMLGLAAGFVAGAIRRTRAREAAEEPPQPPYAPEARQPPYAVEEPRQPPYAAEGPRQSPYAVEEPPHGPYAAEGPQHGPYATEGPRHAPYTGVPGRSSLEPPQALESPRGMWAGAAVSAALGMSALVAAAIVLISVMAAPTRTLNAPAQAGGLRRDDSPGTQQLVSRQRERLKAAGMPNPLTAIYHAPSEASSTVLFIGSSGHIDDPPGQLREFLNGLAASTGASGREPTGYPAGRLKGTVMCLDRLTTGQAMLATCGWADEGTLGVITTDDGDASRTAGLLLSMRDDMEKKA